jgi:diguanylate cyclase (GGDEF)-like protein
MGSRRTRILAAAAALVVIALIGLADYATGSEIGFSLFYLVPISVCAWWFGTGPGVVAALGAALTWFLADVPFRSQEHLAISIWNAATRLGIFLSLGLLMARQRFHRTEMAKVNLKLQELLDRESSLARTDMLTGLPNARAFLERLNGELARSQRAQQPIWLGYVDLDNFKQVNDRFGHEAGDQVLVRIADLFRSAVRKSDFAARLAGDEFALLFIDVRSELPEEFARRFLDRVAEVAGDFPGCDLGASIGVVQFTQPLADAESAIGRVDAAMYRAKARGKNRLVTETAGTGEGNTQPKAV